MAPHQFEEPPISGTQGSGAVFFSGCSLGCIFCQNRAISRGRQGEQWDEETLARHLLSFSESGVHNLNLVTATHYTDKIAHVLKEIKPRLGIPVVWNSSGYETVESLTLLEGLVDVYLPDFKYATKELAAVCAGAPDYPEVATAALREMYRQVGAVRFDADGMLQRGVVVRHLVLPGYRANSIAALDTLATALPVSDIRLSLMRQYTPDFAPPSAPKSLKRRVTSFEYDAIARHAVALGFEGYLQDAASASADFTPDFTESLTPISED
jgi:putative pyruvate formate lyase activating enzyme